jgi:HEPN domain-containing protein
MTSVVTKEAQFQYWLDSAQHDLETAESLFTSGKYVWCLFIGHLVLEKTLKALVIKNTEIMPPRNHNLLNLAEAAGLEMTDDRKQLLLEITDFNIEARYPDFKQSFYEICTKEFAEKYFRHIMELRSWLLSQTKR